MMIPDEVRETIEKGLEMLREHHLSSLDSHKYRVVHTDQGWRPVKTLGQHDTEPVDRALAWLKQIEAMPVPVPNWDSAPAWAKWWAVSAGGVATWFGTKPCRYHHHWRNSDPSIVSVLGDYAGTVELPIGIDWRTTLVARPAAQGEEGGE